MAYIENFNASGDYSLDKRSDYVLNVHYSNYGPDNTAVYDFLARMMILNTESSDGSLRHVPFSQLDPEALHFLREQLVELGGTPPELPRDIVNPSAASSEAWVEMGGTNLAHVGIYPALQKKITRIFNFESRQLQTGAENLRTHEEVFSPAVSFDNLPETTLEQAFTQFTRLGKVADHSFVFRGVTRLK